MICMQNELCKVYTLHAKMTSISLITTRCFFLSLAGIVALLGQDIVKTSNNTVK